VVPDEREAQHNRRSSDAALQNLEFIGSSATENVIGDAPLSLMGDATSPPPAPNLREAPMQEARISDPMVKSSPAHLPDLEPRAPLFLPPDNTSGVKAPPQRLEIDPLHSELFKFSAPSVIDMDSAPAPSLAPALKRAAVATGDRAGLLDTGLPQTNPARTKADPDEDSPAASSFSSSLITSEIFDD
jgi:hypothetical protein